MKKTNKKGFTLVEIMIVVAILGLLAAIGIPSIVGAYSNAQEKTKARNVTEVEKTKAMLTLPTDAGGMNYTTNNTADEVKAAVITKLSLDSIDDLEVNGTAITVNQIGTKASYTAAAAE
jgi:type IV pilus assembly protein PilA